MSGSREKLMFEIFREGNKEGGYEVLFLTELDEKERDREIDRALQGFPFLEGFLGGADLKRAKDLLSGVVTRLNRGEMLGPDTVREILSREGVWAG